MSVDASRLNLAFSNFSKLSHEKYKGYGHVAGFYEVLLSHLMLGYSSIEEVEDRIEAMTEELKAEIF